MIADRLENWMRYPFGKDWETGFAFLLTVTPEIEDGEYRLRGDDVFARVMTYETRDRCSAVLEAHRRYVDIQAVIAGGEDIEWHAQDRLIPEKLYDEVSDAEFYRHPDAFQGRIAMTPGLFAVFFPQDAHMPSLTIGGNPEWVRKVVVKIRMDLFNR